MTKLATILLLIFTLFKVIVAYDIIVNTKKGRIGGEILKDYNGNNYFSFQKIPYAKPPVKKLRFKAPRPTKSWEGVLNGTQISPICPQFQLRKLVGEEDCLFLNVYTPKISNESLPVMVYIHGGGFFEGSGSKQNFGPEFFMPKNVVLVTLNYRLGRFGSLRFSDNSMHITGNYHLKDQVMALKWVRRYIKNFGGNPDLVTIFGESVGGASVNMHLLSRRSKGLFHRAISQSGTAANTWNPIVKTGEKMLKQLGIETKNQEEIVRILQNLPMEDIMNTQFKEGLGVPVFERIDYMPVPEDQRNEPAFLRSSPLDIMKSGKFYKVPYILGYNNEEGLIFQVTSELYNGEPFFPIDLETMVPFDINFPTQNDKQLVMEDLKKTFIKNNTKNNFNITDINRLSLGPWFTSNIYRTLVSLVENMNEHIYFNVFSADTKLNYYKRLSPITKYQGACHMDELGHLFTTPNMPVINKGSDEELAMDNLVTLWTNFAKYGKPGKRWLPVKKCKFNYMDISTKLIRRRNPDKDILDFWHNLYKKYNGDKGLCD